MSLREREGLLRQVPPPTPPCRLAMWATPCRPTCLHKSGLLLCPLPSPRPYKPSQIGPLPLPSPQHHHSRILPIHRYNISLLYSFPQCFLYILSSPIIAHSVIRGLLQTLLLSMQIYFHHLHLICFFCSTYPTCIKMHETINDKYFA